MRSRAGRLVCPRHVHSGQFSVQLPRQNLRPPFAIRVQRHLSYLAGGELEWRGTGSTLRQDRRQVFRRTRQSPWKLRLLGLEIPALELRQCRTGKGYRRHLGKSCPRAGAQVRNHRSWHTRQGVEAVHAGPIWQRCHRSFEGRALRWCLDEGGRQRQVVGGNGPAATQRTCARQRRALSGVRGELYVPNPGFDRQVQPGSLVFRR